MDKSDCLLYLDASGKIDALASQVVNDVCTRLDVISLEKDFATLQGIDVPLTIA